ncbi:uncharacterized protein LOC129919933 [Episyrphus balteatus]|uniref:uncharacterized protein LOC129919933 n=1 Tax=Episyrphus balteatus TaxID=286459 RepID=UPI0024864BA0|nr:uncharacterized protein LOC129919933 [Episyrphus balteatus]
MLPKSMHHCAFLIITFSFSYILCIQNGKTVSSSSTSSSLVVDKLKRRHFDSPSSRQSFFQQNEFDNSDNFQPSNVPTGFRFPDKHQQYNSNSPNELLPSSSSSSSFGYQNTYLNNNQREVANTNQGGLNPYNLALNTGEQHSTNNANNLNNYPYQQQQNSNAIASFTQHHRDSSSNVPNANDFYLSHQQHLNNKNPYYPIPQPSQGYQDDGYQLIQRRPTYAQAFGNYLFNGGQPNYNRPRPTPPAPPPLQESSYSPYQDGGRYPYDDLTSPSGPYSSHQYANQFGNFGNGGGSGFGLPSSTATTTSPTNPLGSLLNSIGGPFAGGNPLSMQIIRGLENIARNDDLQCVPKVLCQMLGSPSRRVLLPSFITSPVLTRFVASLPALSPALIYGRAALLGLSGGEYSCARTYNKCPQNEDDILFYLNNHRGGFFKFFSEPDTSQDNIEHQYTTQPPFYQQQSAEPSIFNFLTGLGPTSSTSTSTSTNSNTNQGNVNSFMSEAVTNGIGSLFGNILSGFLNGQGQATRRKDDVVDIDVDDDDKNSEKYSDLIESNSTTKSNPSDEQVEGRILNNKSNILAAYADEPSSSSQNDNPISFPPENSNDNYETQQFQSEFRFPNTPPSRDSVEEENSSDSRRGKRVNFIDDDSHRPYSYANDADGGTKMIFPDRTGTGNLRFDNDEYFRVGKILNRRRPSDYNRGFREQDEYRKTTTTTKRPTNYYSSSQNSGSYNRYSSSNYYRQDYNQNQQNQDDKEDTSGNVYVTNGQGVIEYYINASGKKIYV